MKYNYSYLFLLFLCFHDILWEKKICVIISVYLLHEIIFFAMIFIDWEELYEEKNRN